jgi:hypothetical protein
LSKYGYENIKSLSAKERKTALKNAIRDIKPLSVYRRLVALSTLNKNKDTDLYKILKEDSEWIKSQVEYIIQQATNSKKSSKKSSKPSKKSSKTSKTSKKSSKKSSNKGGGMINDNTSMMKSYDYGYNNYRQNTHFTHKSGSKTGSKFGSKFGSKDKNKLFYYKN